MISTYKTQKFFAIFSTVAALSACGGGVEIAQQAAPAGPLFVNGTPTPKTTLQSDERSMTGTRSGDGKISALTPITQGGSTQASVAFDGNKLTLIEGDTSRGYDLDAGAGSEYRRGRYVLLNGNGDYAAYRSGEHGAAATYSEEASRIAKLGAISVGNITQDMSAVPATAIYRGTLFGQFVGGSTTPYDTKTSATFNADFSGGTYAFSASSPYSANVLTGNTTPASGLTMTGTGTITGSGFDGTATTSGGMSGTMSGNFYGPNAEEVGGTVGLSGAGDFVGAFHLKR